MAYIPVKDIFPFFGSNTLGQKELSEYNLTRSIRCLNTGNNAFATSASNTPFNLTTTASPITPGSSTIEFTLGEGEGEIGGYYVKIENTTSVKLEGNWQAEGVFYLHLNMTSRGLKYVSSYSENETAVELKYTEDSEISPGEREYSLKIAELVEDTSTHKLNVKYSCHRGLINNIDLTYGSKLKEVFRRDRIYYYLDEDATTYTTGNFNVKLSKSGIVVQNLDSSKIEVPYFISSTVKLKNTATGEDYENSIQIDKSEIRMSQGNSTTDKNTIRLSNAGLTLNSYQSITGIVDGNTFIDLDTGINNKMTLGNISYPSNILGTSIGINGSTGIELKNGQSSVSITNDKIDITSSSTNNVTTISGKEIKILSSGTTKMQGVTEVHVGSKTKSLLATYDNSGDPLSFIEILPDAIKLQPQTTRDGVIAFYSGGGFSAEPVAAVFSEGLEVVKDLGVEGKTTIRGDTTMGSTLEVTGEITAENQISATGIIHSNSNITANGNVTANGGKDVLGGDKVTLNGIEAIANNGVELYVGSNNYVTNFGQNNRFYGDTQIYKTTSDKVDRDLAQNGYCRLANNLLLQWKRGQVTSDADGKWTMDMPRSTAAEHCLFGFANNSYQYGHGQYRITCDDVTTTTAYGRVINTTTGALAANTSVYVYVLWFGY